MRTLGDQVKDHRRQASIFSKLTSIASFYPVPKSAPSMELKEVSIRRGVVLQNSPFPCCGDSMASTYLVSFRETACSSNRGWK